MAPDSAVRCKRTKKDGNRCGAPAMANGLCRVHGGNIAKGAAHYRYKDGRYSKHAPLDFVERMQKAADDVELTSNRAELSLLTARAEDLLLRATDPTAPDTDAWDELYNVLELRRRTNETERKRMVDLNQMVPVEQVFALMRQLYDVVAQHVTDRRTLAAIGTGFRAVTSTDGTGSAVSNRRRPQGFTPVSDVSQLAAGS